MRNIGDGAPCPKHKRSLVNQQCQGCNKAFCKRCPHYRLKGLPWCDACIEGVRPSKLKVVGNFLLTAVRRLVILAGMGFSFYYAIEHPPAAVAFVILARALISTEKTRPEEMHTIERVGSWAPPTLS